MSESGTKFIKVSSLRVSCDGETNSSSEGHPLVWLQINVEEGFVSCRYCETKYIFEDQRFKKSRASSDYL